MSQYYVGVKQVFAYPEEKDGQPGYHVVYCHGQPDAYHSWSPKEEFEKFYLPMGEYADPARISPAMISSLIASGDYCDKGESTTLYVVLKNGTELIRSATQLEPESASRKAREEACRESVGKAVDTLLNFVLKWARNGVR